MTVFAADLEESCGDLELDFLAPSCLLSQSNWFLPELFLKAKTNKLKTRLGGQKYLIKVSFYI